MDNIPEREQPKPEREVSLGEEFQPFDQKCFAHTVGPYNKYGSEVTLNFNNEPNLKIPLTIMTRKINSSEVKGEYFLPFGPEGESYSIDSEDFNLNDRLAKVTRLDQELCKPIDISKISLDLQIGTILVRGAEYDDEVINTVFANFPQETIDLLNRLRIIVTSPKCRLEAKPYLYTSPVDEFLHKRMEERIEDGTIEDLKDLSHLRVRFEVFYPVDSGPLAASQTYDKFLHEGLKLGLPDNPEKLSEIKARFVLAEEQPQES